MIRKLLTVKILSAVLLLNGCGQFASVVLHDPGAFTSGWAVDPWTKNTTLNVTGKTFNFDFPVGQGSVNTIEKNSHGLVYGTNVSMKYEITGNAPVFEAAGGTATVGIYLGKERYYSIQRIPLAVGRAILIVPLTPDKWQTVDGFRCDHDASHISEFKREIKVTSLIGPCFGGQGFAHGVDLSSGSAKFNCISFTP